MKVKMPNFGTDTERPQSLPMYPIFLSQLSYPRVSGVFSNIKNFILRHYLVGFEAVSIISLVRAEVFDKYVVMLIFSEIIKMKFINNL